MEKSRKQKLLIIFALVLSIVSLSIGFAAFSTVLSISSNASVTPNSNTFGVKFSTNQNSLVVDAVVPSYKSNGLVATNGSINNTTNPTLSNLSATFTSAGQYVEYTFYARNEGEYTAYLNSINFIGDKVCEAVGDATQLLVESACNAVNTVVYVGTDEYRETTEIQNHPLAKKTGEQIKIRLEYASNGTLVDGNFQINFNDIMFVYSTIDNSSFMPPTIGSANDAFSLNSKIATMASGTDENIDFAAEPTSGVYIRKGTENHVNPIYYFRGVIANNNVLFANKCWKIVRTTETGGTKLIYNGVPTSDNKCNGDNSIIGISDFNVNDESEEGVNYIYSDGTNSTIKQVIDTWYTANMTSFTDKLEDTVWCNDRSVVSSDYYNSLFPDADIYVSRLRNELEKPSLHCPAEYSLTTSAKSLSNKLIYPVGLLTADELTLAGMGLKGYVEDVYLKSDSCWWTMSPCSYSGIAVVFFGGNGNTVRLRSGRAGYSYCGARPAVSLKAEVRVVGGEGTSDSPYIVE